MNDTIINILADRLEKQAGDIALLNRKLTELQAKSDKYYKWWSDEQDVTTKLEAKLALTPAERIVSEAAEEIGGILKNE